MSHPETETTTYPLLRTKLRRPRRLGDQITQLQLHVGSGWKRNLAVPHCFPSGVLAGPLTAIHANGAQGRQTEEEKTEPPPPLHPEQVRFGHITTEDGLSEGRVWGITQDHRGFLWFTTYDGINRYDGHNFKVYKYDPQNSTVPARPSIGVCWKTVEACSGLVLLVKDSAVSIPKPSNGPTSGTIPRTPIVSEAMRSGPSPRTHRGTCGSGPRPTA